MREPRSHPYSPCQKNVSPPATRSMSSTSTPRRRSTSSCSSPKSSPIGPTMRTSLKKLAASAKCTAAPPSIRSRSPNGVLTVSYAIEPTTVIGIGAHLRAPSSRGAREPLARRCPPIAWRAVRAIQMREFGSPEVLEPAELPVPEPADGEVLIEVSRAGLNFADTHTTSNSYVRKAKLPLVPGAEVAGRIAGRDERVVALTWDGGYAEYA